MFIFKKSDNNLVSLGIGQRALITEWLDKMEIYHYEINDDLNINVNCEVDLSNNNLDRFPDYIQFGIINGAFDCSNNKLKSLRGCPIIVNGYFVCNNNELTNLEHCPKKVEGWFGCTKDKLNVINEVYIRKLCEVKRKVFIVN
jgi:hypothetical protein